MSIIGTITTIKLAGMKQSKRSMASCVRVRPALVPRYAVRVQLP
jgi:hypothetical protein